MSKKIREKTEPPTKMYVQDERTVQFGQQNMPILHIKLCAECTPLSIL